MDVRQVFSAFVNANLIAGGIGVFWTNGKGENRAEKIDPKKMAGYMVLDKAGIRYLEIDYENMETVDASPCSLN